MKKLLILTTVIFISAFGHLFAQESTTDHLKFMGIPITGDVNSFVHKLEDKGFSRTTWADTVNTQTLEGNFVNQSVVAMLVHSQKRDDIYRVAIMFEPCSSYTLLKQNQNNLVELFTKKYGKPTITTREFNSVYEEGSSIVMLGFAQEQCVSADTWLLDNGAIQIQIASCGSQSASIVITYEDKKGLAALQEESMDDI